jgi:hypothetical protein
MEAIYVGGGQHLRVGADLENGIYGVAETGTEEGRENAFVETDPKPVVDYPFVTAMLKGREGNHFSVKAGNAQNGSLSTLYDGPRPSKNYVPMKKQVWSLLVFTENDSSIDERATHFGRILQ